MIDDAKKGMESMFEELAKFEKIVEDNKLMPDKEKDLNDYMEAKR
jgi:hypothetical protein